jgi:hypothetical protein
MSSKDTKSTSYLQSNIVRAILPRLLEPRARSKPRMASRELDFRRLATWALTRFAVDAPLSRG